VVRAAFSLWNERIAPVFDVARHIWIIDAEDGRVVGQTGRRFSSDDPFERALRLNTLQINHLICGAITRNTYNALHDRGIEVISFVAGSFDQVLQAWLNGSVNDGHLAMPGCNRGRRHGMHKRLCRQNVSEKSETLKGDTQNA